MITTNEKQKLKKIELYPYEIEEIIRTLEDVSHGIFVFMKYNKIVKKLKEYRK